MQFMNYRQTSRRINCRSHSPDLTLAKSSAKSPPVWLFQPSPLQKYGQVPEAQQGCHRPLRSPRCHLHFDEGDKASGKKFGCALVLGIERAPLAVTKSMSAKKIARRIRVKPFMKVINYQHLMPTRYTFDVEALKGQVTTDLLKDAQKKKEARKEIKKVLEEKHKSGQNKWFFQKLRF